MEKMKIFQISSLTIASLLIILGMYIGNETVFWSPVLGMLLISLGTRKRFVT